MTWIIVVEKGGPFPKEACYISRIGRNGTIGVVNRRQLAKEYKKKGLIDKAIKETNKKGNIFLRAIEITELKIINN